MSYCSELTAHLQKIKSFQNQLNQQIEALMEFRKSGEIDFKDGVRILMDIYGIRKYLKPELKNIKLDVFLHSLPELPEGEVREITINLGNGLKSSDDFRRAFHEQPRFDESVTMQGNVKFLIDGPDFRVSSEARSQKLVVLSVRDLGFSNLATLFEIEEAGKKLGLSICPPEVGPQLRLQGPKNTDCYVCMEPILSVGSNKHRIFYVTRGSSNSSLIITSITEEDQSIWLESVKFVFCRD